MPRGTYARRLEERRRTELQMRRQRARLSWARLAVFVAAAALAWPTLFAGTLSSVWLIGAGALFGALVLAHDRVQRRMVRTEQAIAHYERGIARVEDRWAGHGSTGERFRDPEHPYADDLDLFGRGSLFELLSTARTQPGESKLADWLRTPASAGEVRERQAAVAELKDRIDLREDLASVDAEGAGAVDPSYLIAWSQAPRVIHGVWPAWIAAVVGLSNAASVVAWFVVPWGRWWMLASLTVGALLALSLRPGVSNVLGAVDRAERELLLLSGLLHRVERERLDAPKAARLRRELDTSGKPPSRRIAVLARLVEINESRRNMMFAPIAAVLLLGTQLACAMERWRERSGPSVERWLQALAEVEALSALAGFAFEHPGDPFPEIVEGGACFEGVGLGHPLLPDSRNVRNDVNLGGDLRLYLISGSNMSGKSTFLRTVGVNAVLALAGSTVRAERLRLTPLGIGACMRVQDSLQDGRSHFYAEVMRLRQIVDLGSGGEPILYLLDEILHGTNSDDRRAGAEALIRGMVDAGGLGLVTTHDLALTRIPDELGPVASNVHFRDQFEGEEIRFDYRLRPGVVGRGNALALMRSVGLKV